MPSDDSASPAAPRPVDRLRPRLSDHAYYVLRELASTMSAAAQRFSSEVRVLDFGCGSMPYRMLFEKRGATYVGADLPGNPAASIFVQPDGTLPVTDESFDVIVSSQVLEHVGDPKLYLAEARRVLAPSGSLLLSTHGSWRYHPHPEDYWRWTASGLRRLLGTSGFRVKELQGIMGPAATATQLWQDAVRPRLPGPFRKLFVALMQSAIIVQEKVGNARESEMDACVYFVIAEKIVQGRADSPAGEAAGRVPSPENQWRRSPGSWRRRAPLVRRDQQPGGPGPESRPRSSKSRSQGPPEPPSPSHEFRPKL
jgi:SAM-dependent methyltransferase